MNLKVKKLHSSSLLPSYAHPGDAGMDIYASEKTVLKPGERIAVKTGISMEIPDGYVGLIWDKSGIAIREGIKTLGGVIDSGYRGELMIGMINLSDKEYVFEIGHKIAQMLIQKIETQKIIEIEGSEKLSETKRGEKGFGSTGK